jgi:hypothetical protein
MRDWSWEVRNRSRKRVCAEPEHQGDALDQECRIGGSDQ